MPKVMPRKAKHMPKPLPDPVTSVTQEKNGVKRKVTSNAKKPNTLAPKRFENSTTKDNSNDTEEAKELPPTTVSDEAITAIKSVEKVNPFIHSMAKPKNLSLDPMELQSITKLQNWCPSIRNYTKESKTETKIPKPFASQYESLNCPKPEVPAMKLTQYKQVLWNPPLRRNNMSPAVTSATPSKRAKICDTVKPDIMVDDESKAEIDSAKAGKDNNGNSKQTQKQAGLENAPTVQHTASIVTAIQGESPGKVGFNAESFDAKHSSAEKLETDESMISYSPITVAAQQVSTGPPEGCPMESSQNSEEDMFLSQEPTEVPTTGIQPEFPSEESTEVTVAKTDNMDEEVGTQEHFNTKKGDSANKLISVDSISRQKLDQSQELSDEDIFGAENQSEYTFKEDILKTASKQPHEDVIAEIKDDQENADEDMFYSDEEIVLSINSKRPKPEPSLIGVADNSEYDMMKTPPDQRAENDFYFCKTVERVCEEITQASLRAREVPEVTEVTEASAIDNDVVDDANNSKRDEVTQSVSVHATTEASLPYASAVRNVDLNISGETLAPTKGISQDLTLSAGDKDEADFINIGNRAKSQNLAAVSGEIDTVNISVSTAVKGEEPEELEDENMEIEGIRLEPSSESVVDDSKIDAPIAVDDSEKEADIPRATGNNETEIKESEKSVGFAPNEIANEMRDPDLNNESADAEIKLTENEKELATNDVKVLSQMENIETRSTSGEPGVQNECKDIISKEVEKEPLPPESIDKESSPEVDSTMSTFKMAERCDMKPYKYEMEQDFDISQSQLIEIESAIMRESRAPGRGGSAGGMPRVAEAAPGFVPGVCGEARMPAFTMPSLPRAPALDWKKKVQEDRQKLRAAVHQLSRLNAMLMSVRREVWPTTGANPDAPLPGDINRQGPAGRRY